MQQRSVSFNYQGHYYVMGEPATASAIWFVLHGYGQLASFFLRNFEVLTTHNIAVVAPEALSRFYLEDTSSRMKSGNDRVGASWMTKEKRLTDIHNYLAFLNKVYHAIILPEQKIPVTILGFSQGAATASRWALDPGISFQRLILWAGMMPPDIDFGAASKTLGDKETVLVYGDKDPFLSDSRFAEMKLLTAKLGIHPVVRTFQGGHEINQQILASLA